MPILLYCLDVCELNKSTLASLDFCVNRFGFRIFKIGICYIVKDCLEFMNFPLLSDILPLRSAKFLAKLKLVNTVFVSTMLRCRTVSVYLLYIHLFFLFSTDYSVNKRNI